MAWRVDVMWFARILSLILMIGGVMIFQNISQGLGVVCVIVGIVMGAAAMR
jgi:hypothetical protein